MSNKRSPYGVMLFTKLPDVKKDPPRVAQAFFRSINATNDKDTDKQAHILSEHL